MQGNLKDKTVDIRCEKAALLMFSSLYIRRPRSRPISGDQFYRRPRLAAPSALLTSLIAHWRLEESSDTRFDAHSINHLTDNNSVGTAVGKFGSAAAFTALNQESLAIADNAALSMGDLDFTLGGWVYINVSGGSSFTGIAGKWQVSGNLEYLLYFDASVFRFYVSANGSVPVNVASGTPISGATWYFVVAWHDSVANTINLQVNNGTVASLAHSSGVFNGTASFYLGRNEEGATYLDGRLDSFSIWKRVLTAPERTQLYNSGNGLDYPFA